MSQPTEAYQILILPRISSVIRGPISSEDLGKLETAYDRDPKAFKERLKQIWELREGAYAAALRDIANTEPAEVLRK